MFRSAALLEAWSAVPLPPVRSSLCLVLLAALAAPLSAQGVPFTSSNLPIVVIDTGGRVIPDEPKIPATMHVVDHGPGLRNGVGDAPTGYDGAIGIEVRGTSSQLFPKKQYAVETRDADGENRNVPLLGFPEENDWVLYAPYSDKSLMRNVLAYRLARTTGRYASRSRFCEVVLNGTYQGIYVLLEKVKRDDARVDVNKLKPDEVSGDDLTGGYVVKIDRDTGSERGGWLSTLDPDRPISYQFHEPKPSEIVSEQADYIESFFDAFESTMASDGFADPETGYPAIVDVGSFVDYFLVTELSKNVDGYRLSAYLHKDKDSKDPRLHAGPVWDFNLAFGNADYYGAARPSGLQVDFAVRDDFQVPFWWSRMARSEPFEQAVAARWAALRAGPFHTDSLMMQIDALAAEVDEAQARNFERWPVLGQYVWPNAYVGATYAEEVDYLKRWLRQRVAWLDAHLPQTVGTEPGVGVGALGLSAPVPTPSRSSARLTLSVPTPQRVTVELFDVRGRRLALLLDGTLRAGPHPVAVDAASLPAGLYVVRARGETGAASRPVVALGR